MAQEYVNLISPGSSDMADSPSRDMQILIVDDQRMIAEILGLHLATTEGFDVSQADSIEATFKEIRQNDGFDIILLDYRMPGMQGIESVARIHPRADPTLQATRRIIPERPSFSRVMLTATRSIAPSRSACAA